MRFMNKIVPAILEKNFSEIKNKLSALRGLAKCAHIDICDGVAVPSQSWPFGSGHLGGFVDFEFDLMVADAVENFDLYMKLGPKRLIFHPEIKVDIEEFKNFLEGLDMYIRDVMEIGIAFKPSDDMSIVSQFSHKVDFLHCMGSDRIGFQGENFSEKALENIKFLKKNLPGVIVSVDIGINLENAQSILEAGADRLIIGSGIWKSSDPIGALKSFQNLV